VAEIIAIEERALAKFHITVIHGGIQKVITVANPFALQCNCRTA